MDRFPRARCKSAQAKYVARWAQSFLESGRDVVTTIPVGDVAYPSSDGRFRLSVPDLSQDPWLERRITPVSFRFWASDKANERIVAELDSCWLRRHEDTNGWPENIE